MFLIVTSVAVLCGSLLFPNEWIGSAYYTALWATMLWALVAAIQRQGVKRAYWIGFLVGSGGYTWLTLPFGLSLASSLATLQVLNNPIQEPRLITTDTLVLLYQTYSIRESDPRISQMIPRLQTRAGFTTSGLNAQRSVLRYIDPYCAAFVTIGHSAIAILCGLAAGGISSRLYRSRIAPVAVLSNEAAHRTPVA
jgi:hypothetical protein